MVQRRCLKENLVYGVTDQRQGQRVCPSAVWKDYRQWESIVHSGDELEFVRSHLAVTPANVYVASGDELINIAGVLACFNYSRPGGTHKLIYDVPFYVSGGCYHCRCCVVPTRPKGERRAEVK